MTALSCNASNKSAVWGLINLAAWKLVPEKFGGGRIYIQKFKDAWVTHNRLYIKNSANQYKIQPELLAGVCWIEVGGDPNFIDRVAFEVRAFDWSGPNWMDRNMTITNNPNKTSFGAVSIQLRTAARTLGLNSATMSAEQLRNLSNCIQKDIYNINLVAMHLKQLIDHDKFANSAALTFDQIKIVGARYNRGTGLSIEKIKQNTSYGNFIVNQWPRFVRLLK